MCNIDLRHRVLGDAAIVRLMKRLAVVLVLGLGLSCPAKCDGGYYPALFENIKETYGHRHPILRTFDFCDFTDKKVNQKMTLAMMEYDPRALRTLSKKKRKKECAVPSNAYKKAEQTFAELLCRQVQGQTARQVLNLCGAPKLKYRGVSCWTENDGDKANWIYYCGVRKLPIRMVFDGDKCIRAFVLSREEIAEFNDKYARELALSCKGKAEQEILALYGEPISKKASEQAAENWQYFCLDPKIDAKPGDEVWHYEIAPDASAFIFMRGKVCFDYAVSTESSRQGPSWIMHGERRRVTK